MQEFFPLSFRFFPKTGAGDGLEKTCNFDGFVVSFSYRTGETHKENREKVRMRTMRCPTCGKEAPPEANFCTHCGTKLSRQDPAAEAEAPTPAAPTPSENQAPPSAPAGEAAAAPQADPSAPAADGDPGPAEPPFSEVPAIPPEVPSSPEQPAKFRFTAKTIVLAAVVVVVVVILVIVLAVTGSGPAVTAVEFTQNSLSIQVGEDEEVDYTITPVEAEDAKLQWTSSDSNVAVVDSDGEVHGIAEGTCTVTATAKSGASATIDVTVRPELSSFQAIYYNLLDSSYASLGADGSYLLIDTNPNDYDDYSDDEAIQGLYYTLIALDLPDSLLQKMAATRALDGRQSEDYDDLEVSWSYHPDKGLEVLFTVA